MPDQSDPSKIPDVANYGEYDTDDITFSDMSDGSKSPEIPGMTHYGEYNPDDVKLSNSSGGADPSGASDLTHYGEYDMADAEFADDLPYSVSSATDCTGLIPTPPPSEDGEQSYQDIYVIPKQQMGNEHHNKSGEGHPPKTGHSGDQS